MDPGSCGLGPQPCIEWAWEPAHSMQHLPAAVPRTEAADEQRSCGHETQSCSYLLLSRRAPAAMQAPPVLALRRNRSPSPSAASRLSRLCGATSSRAPPGWRCSGAPAPRRTLPCRQQAGPWKRERPPVTEGGLCVPVPCSIGGQCRHSEVRLAATVNVRT